MSVYLVDLVCTLLTVTSFAILLVFLMTLWLVKNTSFSSSFLCVVLIKLSLVGILWFLKSTLLIVLWLKRKNKTKFFFSLSHDLYYFFSDFLRISYFWPDSLVSYSCRMEIYTKRSQKSSKKKGRYSFKMQMEDERKWSFSRPFLFEDIWISGSVQWQAKAQKWQLKEVKTCKSVLGSVPQALRDSCLWSFSRRIKEARKAMFREEEDQVLR